MCSNCRLHCHLRARYPAANVLAIVSSIHRPGFSGPATPANHQPPKDNSTSSARTAGAAMSRTARPLEPAFDDAACTAGYFSATSELSALTISHDTRKSAIELHLGKARALIVNRDNQEMHLAQ